MFKKTLIATLLSAVAGQAYAANGDWYRQTAVSPDGNKIAFSYQGNIFVVDKQGGTATPVTMHSAYDGYPVWSNDGKKLAFASDRYGNFDVFVVNADGGKAKRLTYHSTNDIPYDFSRKNDKVLMRSLRMDSAKSAQFPYGGLPELYEVKLSGGTPSQLSTIAMESAKYSDDDKQVIYHDVKGYEDPFRKHHTSSVTRDIWVWDKKKNKRTKLTNFAGEDRNPLWSQDGKSFYYLSEQSGTFNVWKKDIKSGQATQLTHHKTHPVRDLSMDDNGNLVYNYHGSVYHLEKGQKEGKKLDIKVAQHSNHNDIKTLVNPANATEFSVSPSGKEVAFIIRGEVYVTSTEFNTTKRITNTPEQERSVSFSPDGRSLLYAGERDGSWNIYQTTLSDKNEKYFYAATAMSEKAIVKDSDETFQPAYSPDGKEVAYIANRESVKVANLKSKKKRLVLADKYNYSYSDGDQYFEWSPDSKWLAVHFSDTNRWTPEVGIVSVDGKSEPINLTLSGYADFVPHWALDGNVITFASNKHGRRNHGSWGAEANIFGIFLNQKSYDEFNLSKEELALKEELEEDKKKKAKDEEKEDKKDSKDESVKAIDINLKNIDDRTKRLTRHSSELGGGLLSKDGKKLYYLARFEKGFDLWEQDFKEGSTKKLSKLGAESISMEMDKEGKNIFLLADGKLSKVSLADGKSKPISFAAEMELNASAERDYLFEHIWRQTKQKFYLENMHGVDWDGLKKEYKMKLKSINNNRDFAFLMSELLGELNASHTGARYRPAGGGDNTASLGFYPDYNYNGKGVKIAEVIAKGPLDRDDLSIKPGTVITAVDGVKLDSDANLYQLLNHKAGKRVRLTLKPRKKKSYSVVVKPESRGATQQLRYERWVEQRRALVDKLSNGRLGYVHVKGMNTASFQEVYSEVLGRNSGKEALIVDTRFNGGGWLHDDLNTLLSGKEYYQFLPRGKNMGSEPIAKWKRPSVVLMGEGNYSDAYLFPHSYKALEIGKLIGMPVPATGTAVWWERLQSGDLIFGIPQVGMLDNKGLLQENRDLQPDVLVDNDPDSLARGKDKQIEKAVETLLNDLK
ncbi:S41 family peptidase [Pleionea sp. CnH1-48]|uniref:S41 family peptidase n=1 Tax=Pleionea sp. CnH1-48 TaxID=2954494 RepID=UPI002096D7D3|nr:S41 family peptidase [Pleionea sp. CnH1-48]MCO7224966.1 S41 family peptidase [Pleionea sp. CnH1-48]